MERPDGITVGPVRRDEGAQNHQAGVLEESADLTDASDVLRAVLGGEPEVPVQAEPHVVAVQHVGGHAPGHEGLLHGEGQGRLAGARQPGEPDRPPGVAEKGRPVRRDDPTLGPHDVPRDRRQR